MIVTGRFTVNPDSSWSLSAGYGYLDSPEGLRLDESLHRVTVSALYGRRLGRGGQWATAFVWGANRHGGQSTHALLLESEAILDRRNTVFGRAELVQKSAEDLALPTGPGGFAPDSTFSIASVSLGYIREVARISGATLGIGLRGTLNWVPAALESTYGSRTPTGVMIFVRVRPFHQPPSMEQMPDHDMK